MARFYNQIAGGSVERIAALSDGVFAIAMTLIVLEIHVPPVEAVHSDAELAAAVCALAPRFVTYLLSFLTLGIFWVGQQTQLNHLERATRDLSWIHLLFLATLSLMPFSTSLLAEFITFRFALALYWLNILAPGLILIASWTIARRQGLVKADVQDEIHGAMYRRIVVAQALYAIGAALCLINTYWSIGFIVLVQLNYALAPRLKFLQWVG